MLFISSSNVLSGFHPRSRSLSSFKAYRTSCPGRTCSKSIYSEMSKSDSNGLLKYDFITLQTVS